MPTTTDFRLNSLEDCRALLKSMGATSRATKGSGELWTLGRWTTQLPRAAVHGRSLENVKSEVRRTVRRHIEDVPGALAKAVENGIVKTAATTSLAEALARAQEQKAGRTTPAVVKPETAKVALPAPPDRPLGYPDPPPMDTVKREKGEIAQAGDWLIDKHARSKNEGRVGAWLTGRYCGMSVGEGGAAIFMAGSCVLTPRHRGKHNPDPLVFTRCEECRKPLVGSLHHGAAPKFCTAACQTESNRRAFREGTHPTMTITPERRAAANAKTAVTLRRKRAAQRGAETRRNNRAAAEPGVPAVVVAAPGLPAILEDFRKRVYGKVSDAVMAAAVKLNEDVDAIIKSEVAPLYDAMKHDTEQEFWKRLDALRGK